MNKNLTTAQQDTCLREFEALRACAQRVVSASFLRSFILLNDVDHFFISFSFPAQAEMVILSRSVAHGAVGCMKDSKMQRRHLTTRRSVRFGLPALLRFSMQMNAAHLWTELSTRPAPFATSYVVLFLVFYLYILSLKQRKKKQKKASSSTSALFSFSFSFQQPPRHGIQF